MVVRIANAFSLFPQALMASLRENFGRRIRALREAKGWSQERLGKEAGIGGKYVGMMERGEKAASFEVVEKLARALQTEIYLLFVPSKGKAEHVERQVQALLVDAENIDIAGVVDFLKTLSVGLKRLDRRRER
jgi:transcriptional regulator with XRE-family HTH domain